jgi:GPH family glycoside/pentoside/hexuronide:cation symporter
MILMGAYVMQILGSSMVGSLGLYLNIYYVNGGNVHTAGIIQGWKLTAMMALGILCIPVWVWLAEKIGKNRALGLTIAMGFVTNILIYFCYTPKHPYLQILPSLFLSAFGTSVWMLVPSMQADIADYDELNTGERREGSFSSISSWFFKLSMTVTAGVSGVILTWTGFDVVRYGKSQPPAVLHTMLLWYIFLPMVFWTMALALLYFYPLNRATIGDIRRRLEERRGAI